MTESDILCPVCRKPVDPCDRVECQFQGDDYHRTCHADNCRDAHCRDFYSSATDDLIAGSRG